MILCFLFASVGALYSQNFHPFKDAGGWLEDNSRSGGEFSRFGADHDDGFGPGMDGGGQPGRMSPDMHESFFQVGVMVRYLQLQPLMEKFRQDAGKVFLEARDKKAVLTRKRRELMERLLELSSQLSRNPKLSSEMVLNVKELEEVNSNIMAINQEAMEKIRAINDIRDTQIRAAISDWMKKLETNQDEIYRFADFLNSNPMAGHR
jgi:hypothetical protein